MTCRQSQELLSAYLDGELGATASVPLESHLHDCSACSQELRALRQVTSALRHMAEVGCPDGLWENLNARIASAPPPAIVPQRRLMPTPVWAFAAAAAVCLTAVFPRMSPPSVVLMSHRGPTVTAPGPGMVREASSFVGSRPVSLISSAGDVFTAPSVGRQPTSAQPSALFSRAGEIPGIRSGTRGAATAVLPSTKPISDALGTVGAPAPVAVRSVASTGHRPPADLPSAPATGGDRRILVASHWNPGLSRLHRGALDPGSQEPNWLAPETASAPEPGDGSSAPSTAASPPDTTDADVETTVAVAEKASDDSASLDAAGQDMLGWSAMASGASPSSTFGGPGA